MKKPTRGRPIYVDLPSDVEKLFESQRAALGIKTRTSYARQLIVNAVRDSGDEMRAHEARREAAR
jgi:hypothetical protein